MTSPFCRYSNQWSTKKLIYKKYVFFIILLVRKCQSHNFSEDDPSVQIGSTRENVCTTKGCLSAAERIRDYMDESYNPCNNFYAFTCGGYYKKIGDPDAEDSTLPDITWAFSKIEERVTIELKTLLEEEYKKSEPRIFFLAKIFYKACVNTRKFDTEGAGHPLKTVIQNLGGWPVLEGNNWTKTLDWVGMDMSLRSTGFTPANIFHVFVQNDFYNTSRNVLYINPADTYLASGTLARGRYGNTEVAHYKQFMVDMAVYYGASKTSAVNELENVLSLEIELAKAKAENADEDTALRSIADLEKLMPSVPWKEYINGLTQPVLHINYTDRIIRVQDTGYFSKLENILNRTSERTLANYMIWRTVAASAPYSGGKINKIYKGFKQELVQDDDSERWQDCMKLLRDKTTGLSVGLSSMYVRRFFNNESRRAIEPVLEAILKQFQDTVRQSTWVDEETKKAVLLKSSSIRNIIAYPDEFLNDTVLDDYTRNLHFDESRFLKNVLSLNRFNYDFALSGLVEQNDPRLWATFSDSANPNAYYYRFKHAITILAGILQSPIFNLDWPNYAKFGSIGFIIGHELMHAFDSKNIDFDETGSYRKEFFSAATKKKYTQRTNCFRNQYRQYVDTTSLFEPKLRVNGTRTLNENLADNVGLNVSFHAYKNWEKNHPAELPLPGLDYTPEQIFWMTSIHFLCNRSSREYRQIKLIFDHYALPGFRARGSISNSPDFAKAFNCSLGSPMNPEHKCQLW